MIEQSGSGKFVIRAEELKDPVVKVHVQSGFMPSCENNHSQENLVDKEKAFRVLNQISRKKNNDRILERSRKQLEQSEAELQQAIVESEGGIEQMTFRKANARRVILSKRLVSDIQRVNSGIQKILKGLESQPLDSVVEQKDIIIRKQQQLISKKTIVEINKSMAIINSLPINADPSTFREKYDEYVKNQQRLVNQQWARQKQLQDLIEQRNLIKEQLFKELQDFIQKNSTSTANAHLEHINSSAMKFFKLIFGKDYAMRLRTDKILSSNDPVELEKLIMNAHLREEQTKQIYKKFRYKSKVDDNTESSNYQTTNPGQTCSSLNGKLTTEDIGNTQETQQQQQEVKIYPKSSLSPSKKNSQSLLSKSLTIDSKQQKKQNLSRKQSLKKQPSIKTEQPISQFDPFSSDFAKRGSLNTKLIPSYQAKQLEVLEQYFQKDVLQHLFDFFFNPISENIEFDFQQDTWEKLYKQFKESSLEGQNLLSLPSNAVAPLTSSSAIGMGGQNLSVSLPPISSTSQKNINNLKENKKEEQVETEQSQQIGEAYSKEFYQYLKEYNTLVNEQITNSKDEKIKKIEDSLDKCRMQFDFYESQLEMSDRRKSNVHSKNFTSPSLRKQPSQFFRQRMIKNDSHHENFPSPQSSQRDIQNISQRDSQREQANNSQLLINNPMSQFNSNSVPSLESPAISAQLPKLLTLQDIPKQASLQMRASESLTPKKVVAFAQQDVNDDNSSTDQVLEKKDSSKAKPRKILFPSLHKLKQCSRKAVDKRMEQLVLHAKSEQTGEYMHSVQKLYKECRIASFSTKKVKKESIKKNNEFSKNYKRIDKVLDKIHLI